MAPCASSPYPDGRGSVRLLTLPRWPWRREASPGPREAAPSSATPFHPLLRPLPSATPLHPLLRPLFSYSEGSRGVVKRKERSRRRPAGRALRRGGDSHGGAPPTSLYGAPPAPDGPRRPQSAQLALLGQQTLSGGPGPPGRRRHPRGRGGGRPRRPRLPRGRAAPVPSPEASPLRRPTPPGDGPPPLLRDQCRSRGGAPGWGRGRRRSLASAPGSSGGSGSPHPCPWHSYPSAAPDPSNDGERGH